ncbi:hypothetical protein HQ39_02180 [Porphyromonas sp. COT-108 OH2963]|uniref:hypothetical protein n=1 Tax=Porphyromonas canoris TaxID=36875 RepID=UPI00052DCFFD|nr:hypothetical protein [Porphyromonas canoris]KGN96164.1 hypothetical protein HQ39_02180 [Porphyromonas sp. COT-108 OH2963]
MSGKIYLKMYGDQRIFRRVEESIIFIIMSQLFLFFHKDNEKSISGLRNPKVCTTFVRANHIVHNGETKESYRDAV